MANRTCALDGCDDDRIVARGWCTRHYTRFRRYGDANYRIRGEIRDGRKICPSCSEDVRVGNYTTNSAYCRACVASKKRAKPLPEVVPLPTIHCIQCSSQFVPRTRATYCCSQACTKAREASINRYNLAMRGREEANAATRKWYASNKSKSFDSSASYRARKIAAFVENVEREVVLERDGWICQLCDQPIDRSARSPDPMSRSIDHRIPLARGGVHSYSNCQSAHLGCNLSKGARIA